jgi:hypothetical protein
MRKQTAGELGVCRELAEDPSSAQSLVHWIRMAERSRKPKYDFKILIRSTFSTERLCRTSADSRVRKIGLVNGFSYFRRRR